jgi:hypothetical protein
MLSTKIILYNKMKHTLTKKRLRLFNIIDNIATVLYFAKISYK